ncbi:hypothetical protein LSAT2_009120 [Lamellibrachia satsuma]|nr:hypothetical protein LSAT2_009120 [Lamellibrachia satsuma]
MTTMTKTTMTTTTTAKMTITMTTTITRKTTMMTMATTTVTMITTVTTTMKKIMTKTVTTTMTRTMCLLLDFKPTTVDGVSITWSIEIRTPIEQATMSISKGLICLCLLSAVGSILAAGPEPPCYAEGLKCIPEAFSKLEAPTVEAACRSAAIEDCLESAKNNCMGTAEESAMKALVDNYKAICTCTKKVLTCGGGLKEILKNPKTNSTTFIKLCNNTDSLHQCLNESSSSCPPALISMWKKTVGFLTAGCEYADCYVEIERCAGNAAKVFLDARKNFTRGSFGLDAAEIICSDKDRLAECFNSPPGVCPESIVSRWNDSLGTVSKSCEIIPCVKKMSACGSKLAGMFEYGNVSNPKSYNANVTLHDVCSERDNLTACINSSTPECPSELAHRWSAQLDKMTETCELIPCVSKISECGSKLLGMFKRGVISDPKSYILVGNGALRDLCSERDNLTACINSSTPECPSYLAHDWSVQLTKMTASCGMLPCTTQLDVCFRNLTKIVMKPSFDAATLNTVCNEFDAVNTCARNASDCPSMIRNNFTIIPEKYQAACTKIAECRQSLEDCAGDSAKIFLQTIGRGKFDIATAEELCDVEKRLVSCFNQSSVCPRDHLAVLEGSLAKMREHCKYLPCTKKVHNCGVNMFDGIDIRKLNKNTFITFCSNVVDVESCMTTVGNECPEEARKAWKTPMKTWADRCASIVKRYRCDEHQCKNDGTCVATVAKARCTCKVGFKGDYCEIDIAPLTTTAIVQVPGGQGAAVHAVSVIMASVGASILLADQYTKSVA